MNRLKKDPELQQIAAILVVVMFFLSQVVRGIILKLMET